MKVGGGQKFEMPKASRWEESMLPLVCEGAFQFIITKSRNSIKGRWEWQPEGDPVITHIRKHAGIGAGISHRLSSKDNEAVRIKM